MIYAHSMEWGVQYYAEWPAVRVGTDQLSFRELHNKVRQLAKRLLREPFWAGAGRAV
jgi:hypothetical protein